MSIFTRVDKLQKNMERQETYESRGTFKGCKATHSVDQVFGAAAQWQPINLDTELWDYGAPFSGGMHSTRLVCAGTVTKAIGGFTLVGVATAFLTEVFVGSLIFVNTEFNVVTAITDNLNLTVKFAWGANAAGVAYTRSNHGYVIPGNGVYQVDFAAVLSVVTDYIAIYRNQMTIPAGATVAMEVAAGPSSMLHCGCQILCNKFDFITFHVNIANAVTVTSRYAAIAGCPASPMATIARIS